MFDLLTLYVHELTLYINDNGANNQHSISHNSHKKYTVYKAVRPKLNIENQILPF